MQSLGELGAFIPVAGSFTHYTYRFIDPCWAFALGWNYWLLWAGIIMAEYSEPERLGMRTRLTHIRQPGPGSDVLGYRHAAMGLDYGFLVGCPMLHRSPCFLTTRTGSYSWRSPSLG